MRGGGERGEGRRGRKEGRETKGRRRGGNYATFLLTCLKKL